MKTCLFLHLFFFFFIIPLFAQQYQPMVIENAHWQIAYFSANGAAPYGYAIQGDTIVNDIVFKKVYKYDLGPDLYVHEGPYFVEHKYLFGLVREDTLQKKVYGMVLEDILGENDCDNGQERLLYDFSINEGDTTVTCMIPEYDFGDWNAFFVVDSIRTKYCWGAERLVFYHGSATGIYENLVEGLGVGGCLFVTAITVPTTADWGLFLHDYCIGTDEECFLIDAIENPEKRIGINIFPNPAQDKITLSHIDERKFLDQNIQFKIYDPYGKIIKEGILNRSDLTITLTGISSGLYYLKLIVNKSFQQVLKFSKL